jgi:anti-sigma factor RsiW
MKESRFIELLNLYVDQQLSAADASELETEILRNPKRLRTYQQYCRIQKACTRLFEYERAQAPTSPGLSRALAEADRKIISFPSEPKPWYRTGYAAGVAAAAACALFAVMRQTHVGEAEVAKLAPAVPAPAVVQTGVKPEAPMLAQAPAASVRPQFYSVLDTRRLLSARGVSTPAEIAEENSAEDRTRLSWINDVSLEPVRSVSTQQEFTFDTRQRSKTESRVFNAGGPVQADTETIAFQFRR